MAIKSADKTIEVRVLKLSDQVQLPEYQTQQSSGLDLRSDSDYCIEQNSIIIVQTGISIEIPLGYEGQVRSRSGLALKGIFVPNSPGTIDSDYRGEIKVILANIGKEKFFIKKGDRIAQLVICAVTHAKLVEANKLTQTHRQDGGFGSTGNK